MTDSYKPLTTDTAFARFAGGAVKDDVRSAYKGAREQLEALELVALSMDDTAKGQAFRMATVVIDMWFPVFFVEQKEGED